MKENASLTRLFLYRLRNRFGCLILFIIWLILMLMPCFFVTLLVEKEIIVSRSDLPEHEYRIFFLDSRDERGFGLSRGSIVSGGEDESNFCIRTSVNYLLWAGDAKNTSYCDCYEKLDGSWIPTMVGGDAECNPPEPFEEE